MILSELHNFKGLQGIICTVKAIWTFYLWPKLCQDVAKSINKCDTCAKIYPTWHSSNKWSRNSKNSNGSFIYKTIGHLPVTYKGNRWAVTWISLHTLYVLAVQMKETSAENVVQAYLSGILAHKRGSVAILSDNGTELKIKALNETCDKL